MKDGNAAAGRVESSVPGRSESNVAHIVNRDEVSHLLALSPHDMQHSHASRQAYPYPARQSAYGPGLKRDSWMGSDQQGQ